MIEKRKPSAEYRQGLAGELKDLRATGNREGAKRLLEERKEGEPGKLNYYRLAQALQRDHAFHNEFRPRLFDEEGALHRGDYITSNEPSLFESFPYIRNCRGAMIAVGVDQALEFAANGNFARIIALDASNAVSNMTRVFLEVGRRHHELLGKYPTPSEFISYFTPAHVEKTLEMLAAQFTKYELSNIRESFVEQNTIHAGKVESYLRVKQGQTSYTSWISTKESLARVLRMYEEGKILPVHGDLMGPHSMASVALKLKDEGTFVDAIYLSNSMTYVDQAGKPAFAFSKIIGDIPVHDDTVIIETRIGSYIGPMELPSFANMARERGILLMHWHMDIRTIRDRMQNWSLEERERRIFEREVLPEDVGLRNPKPGLIISADILIEPNDDTAKGHEEKKGK